MSSSAHASAARVPARARPRVEDLVAIDQDPERLTYAVFLDDHARSFDPSSLTIVQESMLEVGRYAIQIAIIGESHFVRIFDRDGVPRAVELFACMPATACGMPSRSEAALGDDHQLELGTGGVSLRARIRTDHRRLPGWGGLPVPALGETAIALVQSFPGPAVPRTMVGVRATRDRRPDSVAWETRVRIDTFHEYALPGGTVVVSTETLCSLPDHR